MGTVQTRIRESLEERWPHIVAAMLFALLASIFLNKSLLPGYTLLPLDVIQYIAPWDGLDLGPLANPLISDPFYSFFPRRFFLTEAVRSGHFPLWNPAIMTGTPTIANPNFQPFYLPNLLAALILPAEDALPWLAWFHLTVTGALMYLFLRRHRLHWLACFVGGSMWLLNGHILVWLENPHRLSTAAWVPGIFWAYEAATQDKNAAWAAVGGLFLGLAVLGGQMQYVFAFGVLLGLYALVKMIIYVRDNRRWPIRPMAYLGLLGVIGLGIGSLILLPAGEFASMSQRVRFSAASIIHTRWPLSQLVTLFSPNFYGNPAGTTPYWGAVNYSEMTAYFGVVGLLLALTAPLVARRRRFLLYASTMAIAALAITLGTPLARLLFLFPGAQFIALGRLIILIPFAGVWLAAAGLDGWLARPAEKLRRRRLLALGLALFAVIALVVWTNLALGEQSTSHRSAILDDLWRSAAIAIAAGLLLVLAGRWMKAAGALLLILALVDLLAWGWNYNPVISTEYLYPENEVVAFLEQDDGLYRVLPLHAGKVVFGPNVLSVFGLQEIGGYTPLIRGDYKDLFKSIDDRVEIEWMAPNQNMLVMSHFNPLVSLLNVKYILSANALPFDIIPQANSLGCEAPATLGETMLTHRFRASDPGLNRIDLTFTGPETPPAGTLDFWLWREDVDGEVVAHIERESSEVLAGQAQPFFFAPVPDSAGQSFVLGIFGPDGLALCRAEDGTPQFASYATWLQFRDKRQSVWIYENPNVLPRAFMVRHLVQRPAGEVLSTLHDPAHNWYQSAILEGRLPEWQQAELAKEPEPGQGQATITRYESQEVDMTTDSPAAGFLVLSDAHYPGWVASLDGQPTPLYRVNGTMRGVFVPAGTHQVEFRFRPTLLPLALIIAGISLIVALITIFTTRLQGRGQARGPADSRAGMPIKS
jgi:hypothetical protein